MRFWKTDSAWVCAKLLVVFSLLPSATASPAKRVTQTSSTRKLDLGANVPADCAADPICRELMVRAHAFSLASHHEQALDAYQGAYALHPSALLLMNIGRLQYKLGRPHEAVSSLRRALAQTPDSEADKRTRTQRFLKEAEEAAARTPPPGTTIVTVTAPPTPKEHIPVYKRWQLWTAVGVVVAGSAALAIGLTARTPFDPSERPTYILEPALTVHIP